MGNDSVDDPAFVGAAGGCGIIIMTRILSRKRTTDCIGLRLPVLCNLQPSLLPVALVKTRDRALPRRCGNLNRRFEHLKRLCPICAQCFGQGHPLYARCFTGVSWT
jgi:hypothetical protein